MPPELVPSDEEYASSEDSDFAPDAVPAQPSEESSDEESEAEGNVKRKTTPAKRKRGGDEEVEDAGFENSGDEAIIERGLKKRRKRGRRENDGDDEGGEGELIKTRSMRAQEKIEKKPLATTTASTIDVDALWDSMISNKPLSSIPDADPTESKLSKSRSPNPSLSPESRRNRPPAPTTERRYPTTLEEGPDSMIMIKRTYNFAGKVHAEQKLVPRSSAEAKLYLSTQASNPSAPPSDDTPVSPFLSKRRVPKARRSRFEPVIENLLRRTDLNLGVRRDADGVIVGSGVGKVKEAKKLNTVEMSAMDWATFVDKEGIADELDAAGRAKGAYKARQEFLERVERKKEVEERRIKGLL